MANTIGTAYIQIEPSTDGITGSLTKALNGEAESAGKSAGAKLGGAFGTAAKVGVAGIAALGSAAVATGTALVGSAQATAQYGDNIDKMSQKLGVSSTFYQEWDAVLQHSGTSMDSMGATFKKLSSAVQNGSATQQEAFAQLGLSMEDMQSMSTEEVFTSVVGALQNMEEGTERTALATQLLGKGAQELGPLFNTSAADTQAMIDTVNELGGVMSADAVKSAAAFQDSLQNMQTAFSGVKNAALSELLPSFTTIMDGFAQLASGSDDAEGLIADGFSQLVGNIQSAMPALMTGLTSGLNAIMQVAPELLQTLATGIMQAIPTLLPTIIDLVLQIGNFIIQNLPMLIETGFQIIMQLATALTEALPTLIPAIVEVVLTIVEYLVNNLDMLIDAAIELMVALAEGLILALPILIEKAPIIIVKYVEALMKVIPKLLVAGKEIIIKLKEGLENAKDTLFNTAQVLISNLKNKFTEKVKEFLAIGRNIVDGIKQGLMDAWGGLQGTIEEKVSGLVSWIKKLLGIHSPSKVMADEIGQFIPSGIAQGIENGMGVLHNTISDMTSDMVLDSINASAEVEGGLASTRLTPNTSSNNEMSSLLSLLSTYLPQIAQGENVNITLEGDAGRLFRMMQTEQRRNTQLVGI